MALVSKKCSGCGVKVRANEGITKCHACGGELEFVSNVRKSAVGKQKKKSRGGVSRLDIFA